MNLQASSQFSLWSASVCCCESMKNLHTVLHLYRPYKIQHATLISTAPVKYSLRLRPYKVKPSSSQSIKNTILLTDHTVYSFLQRLCSVQPPSPQIYSTDTFSQTIQYTVLSTDHTPYNSLHRRYTVQSSPQTIHHTILSTDHTVYSPLHRPYII